MLSINSLTYSERSYSLIINCCQDTLTLAVNNGVISRGAGLDSIQKIQLEQEAALDISNSLYLKTGKIPSVTIEVWNQHYNNQANNCGYFGWDTTFKTPDSSFGLCGMHYVIMEWLGQGTLEFNDFPYLDQWVNGQFKQVPCPIQQGVMYNRVNGFNFENMTVISIYGGRKIVFNPTDGLRTSDKVQPRHIKYPFFIVISEIYKEETQEYDQRRNTINGIIIEKPIEIK